MIKSEKDPNIIWNQLTHGTGRIDEEPEREYVAASLLLFVGVSLTFISFWKAHRHCQKYGSLWAKIDRRNLYRYEEQLEESDVSRAGIHNALTPYELEQQQFESQLVSQAAIEMAEASKAQ